MTDGTTDPRKRSSAQQEYVILRELEERSKTDPLKLYEPYPKQQKFIDAVLDGKDSENWFIAANRSGKSDAGAYIGARLARFGDPNARYVTGKGSSVSVRDRATSGWVVSLDFPSSRDIIQPKYFDNGFMPPGATHEPFIPAHEIDEWRVSDQILKLKNGSIIGFKSADSGRTKFQGTEKDWAHFDEEPPKSIYEETVIRIGQRRLRVFGTCTLLPPEGQIGGITWVFTDKIKPWLAGYRDGIGVFNAAIYDNPYIDRKEIERLEAIYPAGSITRRIRLNGELIGGLTGARVYSGFDHRLNVRDQPDIMLRRPLCWTWDFNVEPMVSLAGQRIGDVFHVFKEFILDEGNIFEMCETFRLWHPKHLAEIWIYGDASGKDRSHQTKQTSYQMILNAMKDYPAPVRTKVPDTNPGVTGRINAVNRACKTEDGVVQLEIAPGCVELISDLEQVVSDGKGGIRKTHNKKDPYFRRTHVSDALGYWIHQEAPVKPLAAQETARPRTINIPRPGYRRGRA